MEGAFVVQLQPRISGDSEDLTGRAEEVDSGKTVHFRSGEELLKFLREGSFHTQENEVPVPNDRGRINKKTGHKHSGGVVVAHQRRR